VIAICSLLKISRIGFAVEILYFSVASTKQRAMMGWSEAAAQRRKLPSCGEL